MKAFAHVVCPLMVVMSACGNADLATTPSATAPSISFPSPPAPPSEAIVDTPFAMVVGEPEPCNIPVRSGEQIYFMVRDCWRQVLVPDQYLVFFTGIAPKDAAQGYVFSLGRPAGLTRVATAPGRGRPTIERLRRDMPQVCIRYADGGEAGVARSSDGTLALTEACPTGA